MIQVIPIRIFKTHFLRINLILACLPYFILHFILNIFNVFQFFAIPVIFTPTFITLNFVTLIILTNILTNKDPDRLRP